MLSKTNDIHITIDMSNVTDIPSVNITLEKLQKLGEHLRSDGISFKENDVNNLNKIIEALIELEEERKSVHEKLETETIKVNLLRHDLKILPGIIQNEIMIAVNAARQSNSEALKDLQNQMDGMNNNIQSLETKSKELEKDNAALHPERELLKQQHEEIISQLNQKMSGKAKMQISLNETRDQVRQTNQDIVDLEDGIVQLKEDLIQERVEARQEKKRLEKSFAATKVKIKEQKEQNVVKKKILDAHQEKLVDSEGRLDSIRKSIKCYEISKSKLEADEKALSTQLANQIKRNEELRRRRTEIINETLKEQQEFDDKQKKLMNKIKNFENEITKETEKNATLDQRIIQLHHDLKEKKKMQAEDAAYVRGLDNQLQSVKQNLAEKAEDVGLLQTENVKMSEEIKTLKASHKAVVAQWNKQIEENRGQLNKERKQRMELQIMKDELEKCLDDMTVSHQQWMSEMTETIQEGNKKHVQLSNEGLQLQKEIREDETDILVMQSKLEAMQKDYEEMVHTMQTNLDTVESEILNMEKERADKKAILLEKTPIFEKLEKFFTQRSEEYDNIKKSVVALKNKKLGLEETIRRVREERDGLKAPQENLRTELKKCRSQVIVQINKHGCDTQEIEQHIFKAGCQLRMVLEENQRFEKACKKLEKDLAEVENQRLENERLKSVAENELIYQKSELIKSWEADKIMQEFFASRDEAKVVAFGYVLSKTVQRETKIDEITIKLRGELENLSDFLDKIATEHPETKKKGQKSASSHLTCEPVADITRAISLSESENNLNSGLSQGRLQNPNPNSDTST